MVQRKKLTTRAGKGGKLGDRVLGRVLVVDDEADVRNIIHLILTHAGYNVVMAKDGEEAIQTIRSGDNPLMVDAIICDIELPKISGLEVIAYFRSEFPGVPVLVLTGNPNIKDAIELLKGGVVDYLTKPILPKKLLAVVKKAVRRHSFFN